MAKPRRKAAAADFPVPQSREEAAAAIATIGRLRREIEARKALADDQLGRIAAAVEDALAPVRSELERTEKGVQVWAEAHRAELTAGGKVKHADLATGRVAWRLRPPRVTVRGAEAAIAALKVLGLDRFIRTKEEVDKEACLREPEVAGTVAGISIASEGEDFAIEPAELP